MGGGHAKGSGQKGRHQQNGGAAQHRPGHPVGGAAGEPHGVQIHRTAQLVGHRAVPDALEDLVFKHPGGEQGQKGLLHPHVRGRGLKAHGKGPWVRLVKGPEGQKLHGPPEKLGDDPRHRRRPVLQAHGEPQPEKCQIFSHRRLKSGTAGRAGPPSRRRSPRPGGCPPPCRREGSSPGR